jgi:rhodanese-related sulfurtransferase
MKKLLAISIISIFSLIILSGCGGQNNMSASTEASSNNLISVQDVMQVLNNPELKIIDVRTQEEYAEEHLSNSILIPLDTLQAAIVNQSDISKNSEILVYCRSGKRSQQAMELLTSLGYTNVKSMTGGIISWDSEGYKVCKEDQKTC